LISRKIHTNVPVVVLCFIEGQKTEVCSLTRKEQEVDQQIESSKGFSFLPVKSGGEMEEEMKRRGSRIIQEEETEKGVY
jgi:hypothetical protein